MKLRGIKNNTGLFVTLFATIVITITVIATASLYAVDNLDISDVTFVKNYRAITLSWTYNLSTTETYTSDYFALYRATDGTGANAQRIAVLPGNQTTYTDIALLPEHTYFYAIAHGNNASPVSSITTSTLSWSNGQEVPAVGPQSDVCINPQNGTSCYQSGCHIRQVVLDANPHAEKGGKGADGKTNNTCAMCHVEHGAAGSSTQILMTTQDSTEPNAKVAVCKNCHMSSSVSEKAFVESALVPQQSGHAVLNAANDKGVLECSTCHGVHEKSTGNKGALLPGVINPFGSLEASITVDKTENNAQCTACHDDAQTWYKATQTGNYPTAESHESTLSIASGYKTYPTSGTYPGSTVYNSTSKNGHMKIAAQDTYDTGDCRYCHSSHGSSSQYDGLLAARGEVRAMMATGGVVSDEEKTSGAYASFCLSCHNGSNDKTPWASAPDIASQVALPAGSSEESRTAFLLSAAGHRVSSANADVPAGSALPCYSCHNPHGSKSGNAYNLNDALGSNLTGGRNTCFTCHTSSDGFVLAAGGSSYTAVSSSTPECVGLSRTGIDTINGEQIANKLKLPDGIEAHTKDGTMECSGCHGGVHDPLQASGTGDSDGKSCLQCHNGQEFSEALKYEFTASDSSEAVDWENGYNPHLIPAFSRSLGETFLPESILSPAVQPIIPMSMRMSTQTINKQKYVPQVRTVASGDVNGTTKNVGPYCTGCHAWHTADVGSTISPSAAGRDSGNTLRKNYNSLETANTDYIHTPGSPKLGGLCLSCHNDYLGDSSVGAPTRGPLNDLNKLDSELFNNCFHNYSIELTRPTAAGDQQSEKSKTYYANCAKCHNDADAIANPLENRNTLDLKVHYVPGRRLLARFGILADVVPKTTSGTNEENLAQNYNTRGMCFGCHSRKGEIAGNAGKQYAGKDWYGQQSMPALTQKDIDDGITIGSNGLKQKVWKNTAGDPIGTMTYNAEATFDDMYKISSQPSGYPAGDGTDGAGDAASLAALAEGAGMEASGHQVNKSKADWGNRSLKPYVTAHSTAIRCSECHNTHATGMGAMGSHVEWPVTKKGRVGKTEAANVGGAIGMQGTYDTIYPDQTTPDLAIATDGTRLITLNDFWSRNNIVDNVKAAMVAWLQTSAGGGYSATDAETQYQKLDHNGITPQMVATATGTSVNEGLALEWSRSVDIFCFRCHEESALAGKAHAGGGSSQSHRKGALACVDCHIPTVHGGKIQGLITDRGSIAELDGGVASGHTKMQEHQIFKWTEYKKCGASMRTVNTTPLITAQNLPKAMFYSIDSARAYTNRKTCAVNSACHTQGYRAEQSGATTSGTWQNWTGSD